MHRTLVLAAAGIAGLAFLSLAGPLDPPGGPVGPSYRTLDQVTPTWDTVLPAAQRFVLVMGGAGVLDRETGLVWEQNPDTNFMVGYSAMDFAYGKVVGGRRGWRIPTVEELLTLVDPTQTNPALPVGHPFTPPPSQFQSFWTCTQPNRDEDGLYHVEFTNGLAVTTTIFNQGQVWLVRGGSNPYPVP